MKPVLVTGGAGFIGSHLVAALLEEGRPVRVLDNLSTGYRQNLSPRAELLEGNLGDPAIAARAVADCDLVFHLGALASVPRSIERPLETNATNARGTLVLLEAAARAKVKRFVYASSSSVYGDTPELPKREDLAPNPLSPYAVSKLAGEYYARNYAQSMRLETVSLRFFNVYGPRQDPKSPYAAVIPIFIDALLAGRPARIYGDGQQTRDFTYVGDVVRGLLRASHAPDVSGRVMNLAGGRPISVGDLAFVLGRVLGVRVEIDFQPKRAGDILHSYADPTEAKARLRYAPETPLEEGLRATVEWYRNSRG